MPDTVHEFIDVQHDIAHDAIVQDDQAEIVAALLLIVERLDVLCDILRGAKGEDKT